MALIKCTECGKEISDKAATCPNCGCPVTHELPNELKQSTNSNGRKKSTGCLIIFIIFGAFCFLMVFIVFIVTVIRPTINISTPQSSNEIQTQRAGEENTNESITIIEDVEQFSGISMDDLKNIMGEPDSEDPWTNKTTKGNFDVVTLSYNKNSNHYEFIITDNTVVRLTIYSNGYWNNTGDRFAIIADKKDICKSFNIVLDKNAKKAVDNNFTYKLLSVNDKIAIFDVQDIDSDTYGLVKITYDSNYFD